MKTKMGVAMNIMTGKMEYKMMAPVPDRICHLVDDAEKLKRRLEIREKIRKIIEKEAVIAVRPKIVAINYLNDDLNFD